MLNRKQKVQLLASNLFTLYFCPDNGILTYLREKYLKFTSVRVVSQDISKWIYLKIPYHGRLAIVATNVKTKSFILVNSESKFTADRVRLKTLLSYCIFVVRKIWSWSTSLYFLNGNIAIFRQQIEHLENKLRTIYFLISCLCKSIKLLTFC